MYSKNAKLLAIALFLISGTIATFGTSFLTQPINSRALSLFNKAITPKSFSIPTCRPSPCSSERLSVLGFSSTPASPIPLLYNKAKPLINPGSSSFLPWPILAPPCSSTWGSASSPVLPIKCSRVPPLSQRQYFQKY